MISLHVDYNVGIMTATVYMQNDPLGFNDRVIADDIKDIIRIVFFLQFFLPTPTEML